MIAYILETAEAVRNNQHFFHSPWFKPWAMKNDINKKIVSTIYNRNEGVGNIPTYHYLLIITRPFPTDWWSRFFLQLNTLRLQ
jgi:hypothetical protein